MRLLHLTDAHIYASPQGCFDGVSTRDSFAAVAAVAAAVPGVDHCILGGDNSMDGSAASYRWLATRCDALPVPPLMIPGNHDEPAAAARGQFADTPSFIDAGDWSIVLLDSRVAGARHGVIEAAALATLDAGLAARRTRHCVLFLHHHPLPIDSAWMDRMALTNADDLWRVVGAHATVRALVCGHVHQNRDVFTNGTRVLMTPSTCVQFLPHSARYATDRRAPGFRIIDLRGDGTVATTVVRVPRHDEVAAT